MDYTFNLFLITYMDEEHLKNSYYVLFKFAICFFINVIIYSHQHENWLVTNNSTAILLQ